MLKISYVTLVTLTLGSMLLSCLTTRTRAAENFHSCQQDPSRLEQRSKEIQRIVKADQVERQNQEEMWDQSFADPSLASELQSRDTLRRMRVAQIFAEGCFSRAEDYAAAALVFQHGDVPEHYFQAFIWAKRGMELGDAQSKPLVALTIDRYLVNTKRKQLFGSQAVKPQGEDCWCLYPAETLFPDALRVAYTGKTMQAQRDWLSGLNRGKTCPRVECDMAFESPRIGDAPGIW